MASEVLCVSASLESLLGCHVSQETHVHFCLAFHPSVQAGTVTPVLSSLRVRTLEGQWPPWGQQGVAAVSVMLTLVTVAEILSPMWVPEAGSVSRVQLE